MANTQPAKSSPKPKASKGVGSGKNHAKKAQGYQGAHENGGSRKVSVSSVSGVLGSSGVGKSLDPMTKEALKNVGC